jgi:hypothetical protein
MDKHSPEYDWDFALTLTLLYSILTPLVTAGVAEWQTRRIQNPVRFTPGVGSSPTFGIAFLNKYSCYRKIPAFIIKNPVMIRKCLIYG